MHFFRFLLCSLLTMLLAEYSQCIAIPCKDNCCSFVEGFPLRLKNLRSSYDEIRDYYETNDELEVALINKTVLENFKSPYGCHVFDEVLHFYLGTVLPTAVTEETKRFQTSIDNIGNIFQALKKDMIKCRRYFKCQKPFEIASIKKSYNDMKEKGLYKAMGELDLLFNYIEEYLASKRQKQ
ncbi:interleukin-10 [Hoplias malabaricus]|uniref:interleukin-10 n=1 Tax=Hoplias malabaricus TaxID=27720 RepID=UPI0034637351